jgi:hypothetical protein
MLTRGVGGISRLYGATSIGSRNVWDNEPNRTVRIGPSVFAGKFMIATLFLAIGILFFWLLFNAYSAQEIKGRGWGFDVRTYRLDSQPVGYWLTFASYLACAIWASAYGAMAIFRSITSS